MATNFNYNDFKNGKLATTKIGKAVKFVTETRDGNIIVAQERYRGMGFEVGEPETFRYKKDGTSLHGANYFNELFF